MFMDLSILRLWSKALLAVVHDVVIIVVSVGDSITVTSLTYTATVPIEYTSK